jgi:putative ABC transport system ATP-binding protein
MSDAEPILATSGLTKHVDGNTLLANVDISVRPGEVVALSGVSGAGKSTLLHILGVLDPDFEGQVLIDGVSLSQLSDRERSKLRNSKLGFVFQDHNLLGHLSVLENVVLPAYFARTQPDTERAISVLHTVGLGERHGDDTSVLSGGESQRAAIARALYSKPKLVLCDEPTGNLDSGTAEDVLGLLREAVSQDGTAIMVATHDRAVLDWADRVIRLEGGRVTEP